MSSNAEKTNQEQPSFGIVTQYVKDLSFENFYNLGFTPSPDDEPKLDVQVKVNADSDTAGHNIVELFLSVSAKSGKDPIFLLELTYVGIFVLENFPEDLLKPTIYIECPRLLFPFARSIVANTVADGNMPMPLLPPVDFAEMFMKQLGETSAN